jgi:cytochrome c oxidase cbb3-type subunit 4
MDINTVRGLITLVLMLAFLGLVAWLMFGTRAKDFEAAARMPLQDDDGDEKSTAGGTR